METILALLFLGGYYLLSLVGFFLVVGVVAFIIGLASNGFDRVK